MILVAKRQKKPDLLAIRERFQMDIEKRRRLISVSICVYLSLFLSACGGNNSALSTPTLPAIVPTETLISSFPVVATPTPICIDGLAFKEDVTIPDSSIVMPGSTLDKQWLVQNSGSCNWDSRYRLRLVGGDALGASPEQALYPARAGVQVTLRIIFTAPLGAGEYLSEWQAFDAKGISFGEAFFIKIIVQ
jgi:hypothetical protein